MEKSKSLAALIGPSLLGIGLSELAVWNPPLYNTQSVPLVYLSGILLFVAGLSIVRRHNLWIRGWQTVITLIGWFGLILGLIRMFFPQPYIAQLKNDLAALLIEGVLILIGIFLTAQAFLPNRPNNISDLNPNRPLH